MINYRQGNRLLNSTGPLKMSCEGGIPPGCTQNLVVSLRLRQRHERKEGVLRKWQSKSYVNTDRIEKDKDRLRDNFPFITALPPPPLLERWDKKKPTELSLNLHQFVPCSDTWTWKYDSRAALARTRTSVYMHVDIHTWLAPHAHTHARIHNGHSPKLGLHQQSELPMWTESNWDLQ